MGIELGKLEIVNDETDLLGQSQLEETGKVLVNVGFVS